MDYTVHIDTISMGLPILLFKGSQVKVSIFNKSISSSSDLLYNNSLFGGQL